VVLGSGVYRIGSSVEFDWCAVRAVRTLRQQKVKTIMVNYNPETVSTDYDEADKLYFENINVETILDIYHLEQSSGVIISMGGQTPNNIALPLHRLNVKILGTSPEMIDSAENRYKFSRMLDRIQVDQPAWKELTSFEEANEFADNVGYPVLVRPSYVLSGAAMNTVYSKDDLASYLKQAADVSREHPVVISKYIENAKEIEMDAVAKDGKMIMHVVSEHVENAGVHSGDATLILPPQDLDPETIRRIEEATRKIGNALNVTGPYNIQFIAKDNEIKVIECNVRASRSFPFVSKVLGVDLIEMATLAIMGLHVDAYPAVDLPKDYVGIKVPQFSFSRLSGADPVLGVEMASTGEVACFGRDKYEAYMKALVSTGFRLPKKNILLSIGSFKEKTEMLPSIKKLHQLGYKLFATAGTADFIQEHGIPVQYLEILSGKDQKSEYSLTQHLENNLIDLYINLPSANRFRRPASYMSRGYQTRRMAVDYHTPLVTNVKNAKLLVEAISRHNTLEISNVDSQSSHPTVILPGLINIAAFVPGLAKEGNQDLIRVTKESVTSGFTMVRVLPIGVENSLTDTITLKTAVKNSMIAHSDFNFSVAASASNSEQLGALIGHVGSLFIPFNHLTGNINKVAAVTSHFDVWPENKPMVTDAKTTDLASILLLASLHNRNVHVTSVSTKDDIKLIALSKAKGLKVTCDVAVYALFFTRDDYPECAALPTLEDQNALWKHLDSIDCFSVGTLPYQLAYDTRQDPCQSVGIADTLPLLFTAVSQNRLTLQDVIVRLHDNPKTIFDIHDQVNSSVEVEIGRPYVAQPKSIWSPLVGRVLTGVVKRVIFHDKTVSLDGCFISDGSLGKDWSAAAPLPQIPYSTSTITEPAATRSLLSPRLSPADFSRIQPAMGQSVETSVVSIPQIASAEPQLPELPHPSVSQSLVALLSKDNMFKRRHILSVNQFSRADLHYLFTVALEIRLGVERWGMVDLLRGRLLCTMFVEPSTRTSASFDAAMQRLGGRTVAITATHSSLQKGETLEDTIRTLACYGDAIVLRHPVESSAAMAAKFSPVPVINGGKY
jgi:carbamoyl-phosphate synthase/aspartate carbamoyltransferase